MRKRRRVTKDMVLGYLRKISHELAPPTYFANPLERRRDALRITNKTVCEVGPHSVMVEVDE